MFFPTTFLQYVKNKYENNNSCRKDPATNMCGTNTTSGTGNVEYVIVRGLVLKNDTAIPCSEIIAVMIRFCDHILHMIWKSYLNLYAGESVKIKPGDLMVVILYETTRQNYYFPGMVNLVKEFVECHMINVTYRVMIVQEFKSLVFKILMAISTIVGIVRMDIEMSVSEVGFRNSYHTRSMIRLTICFTVRNSKGWEKTKLYIMKRQTVYNSINVVLCKLRSRKYI